MPFIDPDEKPSGFTDPDDENTHISVENGVPVYKKGALRAPESPHRSILDYAKGVGEAGLQGASGLYGAFEGSMAAIPKLLTGDSKGAEAKMNQVMQDTTYQPRTELGQQYGEHVSDAINNMLPMAPVHLPGFSAGKINRALRDATHVELPKEFIDPDHAPSKPMDNAVQQPLFDLDNQGKTANQFEATPGEWRTDENGIPIRADLSMDAQNAGNPLQRNLFGDQLNPASSPVGQAADLFADRGQQENIPITEAMDNMSGPDRTAAIDSQLKGSVDSSGELEGAKLAATPDRVVPRGQRGGIDIQALEDGMGFVAKIGDKVVGYLKDNLPAGMAKRLGEDANVDIVKVDPAFQGQGIGKALYAAFSDKHEGNIAPSGKTSPSAWKLWQRDYPDKVEKFVNQEAGRLADGAPLEQVLGNITDPTVRRAVVEKVNPLAPLDRQMSMPASQRGGINVKAVKDAVEKMNNLVDPPEIPTKPQVRSSVNEGMGVPGLKDVMKNAIPEDPAPADIKAAVMKEGAENGKIVLKNFRAGANMVGEQRQSALVQGVYRMYNNASKRADLAITKIVKPVEQLFKSMKDTDVVSLAGVFKDEMFKGMRYSDEQLGKLLNAKQMETYKGMRDMFDRSFERMNQARTKAGMEPITAKEAYLSSRWTGNWRTPVYDKAGKLVWYIAETSRNGAKKALDHLAKNVPDLDIARSKIESRVGQLNNRGPIDDAYTTMLGLLDKSDPRYEHIKSVAEDAMADNAYDTLGQKKHFEPKNNVRGFVGDQPWRSPAKDAYDMFKQQMNYAKNAFTWSEMQTATEASKGLLADKDIQALQPNNADFVRQYARNKIGFGENKIIKAIENAVTNASGYDRAHFANAINDVKSIWLMQKLALNLGYYAAQGLQLLNSIPEHGYLTGQGYKHNMLKTLAGANVDFGAGSARNGSHMLGKELPLPYTSIGKAAWKYMEDNNVAELNITDEARGLGQNKFVEGLSKTAGFGIQMAENIIRSNTFLQFAHHLNQSGKFVGKQEKMFQMAEEATKRAMVDFDRSERANVFNQAGLVGSAASTLKSYPVNYWNNLARYGQEALNGRPRALLHALALQGTVYGVMNLPGVQDADNLWEALKPLLPDAAYHMVKNINIKKSVIDTMGDWGYGGASVASGVNMASRGSIDLGPSINPLDSMFPMVGDMWNQN